MKGRNNKMIQKKRAIQPVKKNNFFDALIRQSDAHIRKAPTHEIEFKLTGGFRGYAHGKSYASLDLKPSLFPCDAKINNEILKLKSTVDLLRPELKNILYSKRSLKLKSSEVEDQYFFNMRQLVEGSGLMINPYDVKAEYKDVIPLQIQELKKINDKLTRLESRENAIVKFIESEPSNTTPYFFDKMQMGLSSSPFEKSSTLKNDDREESSTLVDHAKKTIEGNIKRNLLTMANDVLPIVKPMTKAVSKVSFFQELIKADSCKQVGMLTTTGSMIVGASVINRVPMTAIPIRTLSFLTNVSAASVASYGSVKIGEFAEAKCREIQLKELDLIKPMKR